MRSTASTCSASPRRGRSRPRAISAWRTVLLAPPDRRGQMLAELELPSGLSATLDDTPLARPELPPMPPPIARLLRLDLLRRRPAALPPARGDHRLASPRRPASFAGSACGCPSGEWLNLRIQLPPPRPWHSETFLIAFAAMTLAAGAADPLGGAAADPAGAGAGRGGRAAGPRRQRAAAAGERADRGRHRRACLQHHGGAHPPLRRRPHPDAGRHRPRPAHADHPAAAARRVHGRRRAAAEDAGRPRRDGGDGRGDPGLRARRRGGRADRRARPRRACRTVLDEAADAHPGPGRGASPTRGRSGWWCRPGRWR